MAEKILLVDDEEGIRKVLGISLSDSGYQVFTAKSGEEALQIFKEQAPPIVMTDIKMPGMDGIELLQKMKKENPDAEVIMITGHGDMELAIQSLKHEATDFITKPIHDDALEIALKRAKERISLKTQIKEYTENLEKLVEEKTEQLVEAERLAAVGQTVAGLAHAIKNITGGLTGGIFVLEKGIALDNKKYLHQGREMVEGNVEKIKSMAMDLLNFAKEREPEYQLCDPNKPLREVFDLMAPRAREYGIALEMDLDENLPHFLFDPEGIHRCLMNLVTNAIDACAEVGCSARKVEVVLRSFKPKGWAVQYQVVDNGCGMDEETKDKVFQSFFSTKGSRGTGLGLMITKKIVDEHGGVIELESEKSTGSKFSIKLPEREKSPVVHKNEA
ncbi:MAG: response regulator receiver protein [Nitrospira bacterium SG8_3]|nr:MAG: response regulator receiver protein [Nitrospira bacterium SG8_3]